MWVGVGVDSVNDYKGSAAYRDIYIQLTSSGATAKSEEYLTFLKDYGFHANASGEPIMPPSVSVWISNNGVTTAVEADDVSIDGNNYTICGIKWNGSAWDYSAAGQGKSGGGSSLPSYTSADKGKVLTIGEGEGGETTVIVPEQTVNLVEGTTSLSNVAITYDDLVVGDTATLHTNNGVQSNEYEMTVTADTSGEDTFLYYLYTSDTGYYQIFDHPQNGWMLYAEGIEHTPLSGAYTVSLTSSVPSVEPKWEAAGGVYTLSQSAGTALMGGIQSAVTTAATDGFAEANVTTGFDSDDVAMIEKMADDFSSGSPFVLQINGMDNTFSPVISSNTSTIGTKFVTFNIPLYRVANMFFNIIITLNASDAFFSTISVIKLAST